MGGLGLDGLKSDILLVDDAGESVEDNLNLKDGGDKFSYMSQILIQHDDGLECGQNYCGREMRLVSSEKDEPEA